MIGLKHLWSDPLQIWTYLALNILEQELTKSYLFEMLISTW